MAKYKIKCNLSGNEAFIMGLVWAFLCLVTFGAAAIFMPFFVIPTILNRLEIEEA